MKRPTQPPPDAQIFEAVGADVPSDMKTLLLARQHLQAGKWYTWDDVRHRARGWGVDAYPYWRSSKLLRVLFLQELELKDDRQQPFKVAQTQVEVQKLLAQVDRQLGGHVGADVTLGRHERDRIIMRSLREEAWRSSEIEGAVTTRQQAMRLLRSAKAPRDRSEQMVLNNYRAMEFIRHQKEAEITIDALLELHSIVTRDTLDEPDDCGRLRTPDENVHVVDSATNEVLHTPPSATRLRQRLEKLLAFINTGSADQSDEPWVHSAVRAIVAHFMLAWEHPFADGNGRCARALWYWVMLRKGFWMTEYISISEVISERRPSYYRAFLYTEDDDNDLTYFVLFHLRAIRSAIEKLNARVKRQRQRLAALQTKIGDTPLNHRQKALLSHAIRHPGATYTYHSHQQSHDIAYGTARSDLMELADRGFLLLSKEGRQQVLISPSDLEERLA